MGLERHKPNHEGGPAEIGMETGTELTSGIHADLGDEAQRTQWGRMRWDERHDGGHASYGDVDGGRGFKCGDGGWEGLGLEGCAGAA